MGDRLAPTAFTLEKKLKKQAVGEDLKTRLHPSELAYHKHDIQHKQSHGVNRQSTELAKKMRASKVGMLLETRRPSVSDSSAPRIHGVKNQLEKRMNKDAVSHLLESRPHMAHLVYADIVKDASVVAPSLHAPRSQLHWNMNKDNLAKFLAARHERDNEANTDNEDLYLEEAEFGGKSWVLK